MSEKKLSEVRHALNDRGLNARLALRDETPLIWAVSEGYDAIALALIEAGAALDAQNSDGNTALIRSACEGRAHLTRALIEAGAALDIQNVSGYSALILARRRGNHDVAALLDAAGASRDLVAVNGETVDHPGDSPKAQLRGPRDAEAEAEILSMIKHLAPT